MAGGCVTRFADDPELLTREDLVALTERAGLRQVHVGVVEAVDAMDHEVVARGRLVGRVLDGSALGGDELRAAVREHVLTLMAVAGATGAEAGAGAAVVVSSAHGEEMAVEVERVATGIVGRSARRSHAALVDDSAEGVAALRLDLAVRDAGPGHGPDLVRSDLWLRPRLDERSVRLAGQFHVDIGGRRAVQPIREDDSALRAEEPLRC